MRPDVPTDLAAPAFVLNCPGYRSARQGGSLTFTIGEEVRAEISHADLLESWQEAASLSPDEIGKMSAAAAGQLARILESGLETADLTEAVTDAAVVLLLALKHQGIASPKRIPPCTVMWHGPEQGGRVLLGA
jgi:hypothetical protein